MCDELDRAKIVKRLNALVVEEGRSYLRHSDGCLRFLKRAYRELGVEIDGTAMDRRKFQKVDRPEFGVTVIFENVVRFNETGDGFKTGRGYKYHVGLMLDERWCIQSSHGTFGVGKIEITRYPFNVSIKGFYRPLCF